MKIEENVSLKDFSTFKVGGPARYFCRAESFDDLKEAFRFAKQKKLRVFVLGGGSNILLSDDGFKGLVIKVELKGVRFFDKKGESLVEVGAGENWDSLVKLSVSKNLWGLENLSGIPGTAGAAPIQNIGAYGAEVKDTIKWVELFDPKFMKRKVMTAEACRFSYRDSRFKHTPDKRYIITRVTFLLSKNGKPNLEYKDLTDYFADKMSQPTLEEMREAVLKIRLEKLPDYEKIGTAGSFFKNPVISQEEFNCLQAQFPDLPGRPFGNRQIKISLAYIIDKILGLKGFRKGQAAVHERQALVLVNLGSATVAEILSLAEEIKKRVKEKTGIEIEREVEVIA